MARGPSGRIVIEIDPELKRDLHSALVAEGSTLKDWFIENASDYLERRLQPEFNAEGMRQKRPAAPALISENPSVYRANKKS